MDTPIRKKLWNIFYAEVLADILITGQIMSPSLKKLVTSQKLDNIHATLLIDLKTFFDNADIEYVYSFFHTVMEESLSQKTAHNLTNTV